MDPLLTTIAMQGADHHVPSAHLPTEEGYDPYQRARVCTTVFDLLAAAQSDALGEYLKPIPVTRLRAAQNACREIGASRIASALQAAQLSLTRVGPRTTMAQAVATLTSVLKISARDDGVDQLITAYSRSRSRCR